jgi:hypothetical protein
MPRKKDVAPRRVREVHAHRRAFAQDRIGAIRFGSKEFAAHAQRLILWMTHAKHPLVATHRANAAPDLIRERLKGETMISRGERTAQRIARTVRLWVAEKTSIAFFKSALSSCS